MKPVFIVFAAMLFAGCSKPPRITFIGKAPGVNNGVFIIKNRKDSTILGENIKNGSFRTEKLFNMPGYYTMDITSADDKHEAHLPFEVYLDTGKYVINVNKDSLFKYPDIKTSSAIQNELSVYHGLPAFISAAIRQHASSLSGYFTFRSKTWSAQQISYMKNMFSDLLNTQTKATTAVYVLDYFVYSYPNNHIAAHEMLQLDLEQDAQAYYDIFQRLNPALKNSAEGKQLNDKLSHLVKLVPGAIAPALVGKTTGGNSFAITSLRKKVILLDFWRSTSQLGRINHQVMTTNMLPDISNKNAFGIVSVSLDSKADWWKDAVKQDQMTWTQVSDLKGDDSPNATNYSITTPAYLLPG